ncbi:hypothetical protein, partial [Calidithermus terrae]|uniref:hypothetical protein n=1 Tax=Calidithermus terrae TaxID=1408545 RepID=UPI001FE768BA
MGDAPDLRVGQGHRARLQPRRGDLILDEGAPGDVVGLSPPAHAQQPQPLEGLGLVGLPGLPLEHQPVEPRPQGAAAGARELGVEHALAHVPLLHQPALDLVPGAGRGLEVAQAQRLQHPPLARQGAGGGRASGG